MKLFIILSASSFLYYSALSMIFSTYFSSYILVPQKFMHHIYILCMQADNDFHAFLIGIL